MVNHMKAGSLVKVTNVTGGYLQGGRPITLHPGTPAILVGDPTPHPAYPNSGIEQCHLLIGDSIIYDVVVDAIGEFEV